MGYCRTRDRAVWPVGLALVLWGWSVCAWAEPLVAHPAAVGAAAPRPEALPAVDASPLVGAQDVALHPLPLPAIDCPTVDPGAPDPRLSFLPSAHAQRRKPAYVEAQPIHIPEPASVVLLTTGAVGLLARRALRRGQAANRN